MKAIWNSLIIAFSMYSKIPMIKSDWTKENMRYVMCFFPMVGLVIGVFSFFLMEVGAYFLMGRGLFFLTSLLVAIPVFITGGIHLDGLLDTADALSSYQEKEKRLEILKDPRAGAFAIITGLIYFILYLGIYSLAVEFFVQSEEDLGRKMMAIIGISFILSRSFSGLSIVTFPMAKNTGLAATFSDMAQKRVVKNVMLLYIIVISSLMIVIEPLVGSITVISAIGVFLYYKRMSIKMFGGITGDLCGWFVQICELTMAFVAVIGSVFLFM